MAHLRIQSGGDEGGWQLNRPHFSREQQHGLVAGELIVGDSVVHHLDELVNFRGRLNDRIPSGCLRVRSRRSRRAAERLWLTSLVMEMKLWRANEADVRDALNKDIAKHGESSRFMSLPDDEFALRSCSVD